MYHFLLGFALWWIFSWVKKRFIKREQLNMDELYAKLPKDLGPDSNLSSEQKRCAYENARKKFEESKKEKDAKLPFFDELPIHNKVKEEFGYIEHDCNEGAFALAARRRQKREALLKFKAEKQARINEISKSFSQPFMSGAGMDEFEQYTKANTEKQKKQN